MKELEGKTGVLVGAIFWVTGEIFTAESETANQQQPRWNENQTVLATAVHNPDKDTGPLEGAEAGSWSLGIVEQLWSCCWPRRDRSRGCEGGDCGGKCLWRKTRQSWKQRDTAESHIVDGAITIASFSPHASIGSWTIERLAHQTPATLNYRIDPSQGGPSMCLTAQIYRVGPQPGWGWGVGELYVHRSTE